MVDVAPPVEETPPPTPTPQPDPAAQPSTGRRRPPVTQPMVVLLVLFTVAVFFLLASIAGIWWAVGVFGATGALILFRVARFHARKRGGAARWGAGLLRALSFGRHGSGSAHRGGAFLSGGGRGLGSRASGGRGLFGAGRGARRGASTGAHPASGGRAKRSLFGGRAPRGTSTGGSAPRGGGRLSRLFGAPTTRAERATTGARPSRNQRKQSTGGARTGGGGARRKRTWGATLARAAGEGTRHGVTGLMRAASRAAHQYMDARTQTSAAPTTSAPTTSAPTTSAPPESQPASGAPTAPVKETHTAPVETSAPTEGAPAMTTPNGSAPRTVESDMSLASFLGIPAQVIVPALGDLERQIGAAMTEIDQQPVHPSLKAEYEHFQAILRQLRGMAEYLGTAGRTLHAADLERVEDPRGGRAVEARADVTRAYEDGH